MKLGNFGKTRLRQSQNNTFLKEFCPGKEVGLGECWN